jgi:eukaryotic-like serine/threonine-protein kinase
MKVALGDRVLDRYRVDEQIASGGHSVVFRGTDERLSRPVCIKVFSGLGGKSGVGRTSYEHFVQEAFALSRLTHPNTLRIYDFGHLGTSDAEGMPLQVCEFMNGGTLSNIVREQGKQSLAETVRIIGAMCAALGEAHALGIVHRDIKPQNILFGSVGTSRLPKLADFGIAKWSADEPELKRAEDTAIVAGQKLAMYSPSWAAPEQLAGQVVSAQTDIYSLAVVAIYMLSGRAIFADEDVYAGYKKRRQAADLVREALGPLKIPNRAILLLSKALAFEPKQRLASVDELATELAASLDIPTEEIPSLPEPTEQRIPAVTPPEGNAAPQVRSEGSVPPMPAPAPAWTPPVARQPWMATAPTPTGPPVPLVLGDQPQPVGDRTVAFVHATTSVADLAGGQGRVRVTFLGGPTGARVIHLKGMSCFVAHLGGRPSAAVQIDQPGDIALVTPRIEEIGHIRVATGFGGPGHLVFPIGDKLVAISTEDCSDPILFDFGPGSCAYFVYTRGRAIPKPRRR